jgi:hypothetical protein
MRFRDGRFVVGQRRRCAPGTTNNRQRGRVPAAEALNSVADPIADLPAGALSAWGLSTIPLVWVILCPGQPLVHGAETGRGRRRIGPQTQAPRVAFASVPS